MERAIRFYAAVFGVTFKRQKTGPLDMAWFPWIQNGLGAPGSLIYAPEFYTPSSNEALVYFTAHSGDLNNELSRIEPAGGKVLEKKALITNEIGYMALVLHTEGNRIALHSRK